MKLHIQVLILLAILYFVCSACNRCDPPPCERTQKVVEWTSFFKENQTIRFTNGTDIDTLDVTYEEKSEYCGGEECLTWFDAIYITVVSQKNTFSFTINDMANDRLYFCKSSTGSTAEDCLLFKPTENVVTYESMRGTYRLEDITINGQTTDALIMNFTETDNIQSITISKDLGIVSYTDKSGNIWRKG